MSSSVTDPTNAQNTASDAVAASTVDKGKGKSTEIADESMESVDDEEEEDDDDDDDEVEEDDDEEEETFEEIDPSAILPTGRRTRGVRVDYTSKEALAKAGLTGNEHDEDDDGDTEMN